MAKNLISELQKETLDALTIFKQRQQFLDSHQSKTQQVFSNERDYLNIKAFLKSIQKKSSYIGKGQFGKVFSFQGFLSQTQSEPQQVVGKEIIFGNDYEISKQVKEDQENFLKEILTNKKLQELDPEHLYFAQYFQTYSMTNIYHKYNSKEGIQGEGKLKMALSPKKENFMMVIEYLNLEMVTLMKKIINKKADLTLNTRLRIF
jgi:hypothetical protein